MFGTTIELDSAAPVSTPALVGGVRAALAAARGGGPARASESWGDGDVAARQAKKKQKKRIAKTPDDASPFVASGEGTLPERGSDGEKAVRSRPRTSLGDGVVKPGGSRIAWAQLLHRIEWVDVWPALTAFARGRQ